MYRNIFKGLRKKKISELNYNCFQKNNQWDQNNIPVCQKIFEKIIVDNKLANLNYLIDSENNLTKGNIYLNYLQLNFLLKEYISGNFPDFNKGIFNNAQTEFYLRIIFGSIIPPKQLEKFRPYYPQFYITKFPGCHTPYNEYLNSSVFIDQIISNQLTAFNKTNKPLFLRNSIPNSNLCCLIFGSYSCPSWRNISPQLVSFCMTNDVKFLYIYTQEAHTKNGWQIPKNIEDRINYDYPTTTLQRIYLANQGYQYLLNKIKKLNPNFDNINNYEFPMLIDSIKNKIDQIFEIGGPYRVYLLEGNNIIWRQGLHQSCLNTIIDIIKKKKKLI